MTETLIATNPRSASKSFLNAGTGVAAEAPIGASLRVRPMLKRAGFVPVVLLALFEAGCGSSKPAVPPAATAGEPVYTYYSMNTLPNASSASLLYTIDHVKSVVEQSTATMNIGLAGSGSFTSTTNGFLAPVLNTFVSPIETAEAGNWAVELPGVAGFFYQSAPNASNGYGTTSGPQGQGDTTQNVVPLVSNTGCPSYTQAQTFQFITFPGNFQAGGDSGLGLGSGAWNPLVDTAYGTVSLSTVGSLVNLIGIQQYLLPSAITPPGIPVTVNPAPFSASGGCGSSLDGSLVSISVPVVTSSDGSTTPVTTAIGISSGLLLQDNNGATVSSFQVSNLLGGGYGALGLAQPEKPLDTSGLVAANYSGFLSYTASASNTFSTTAAFSGASAGSTDCASFQQSLQQLSLSPSANTLYGGEFAGNDPRTNSSGQCDFAIDLDAQDTKTNGLYPNATLYIASSFPLNQSSTGRPGLPYAMPAVAIAGPVAGKNVILIVSADTGGEAGPSFAGTAYSAGIYLLQQ